jgi:Na+/H+-dicarboxylate symporter
MALFKKKISLPTQVIIALVLGVIAGLLLYGQDDSNRPAMTPSTKAIITCVGRLIFFLNRAIMQTPLHEEMQHACTFYKKII